MPLGDSKASAESVPNVVLTELQVYSSSLYLKEQSA